MSVLETGICQRCGKEWTYVPVAGVDHSICFRCLRDKAGIKSAQASAPIKRVSLQDKYKDVIKSNIRRNREESGEMAISKHQVAKILYSFMSSEGVDLIRCFKAAKDYMYEGMHLEPKQLMEELISDITDKINDLEV